jgi:hypothetical protein
MPRVVLTEQLIDGLVPDPSGRRRIEARDSVTPGLIVRVASRRRSFAVHTRFPGARHPTRRAIGEVGTITLDDAREVARSWFTLIREGIDPASQKRGKITRTDLHRPEWRNFLP